jgi:hypothetical protein
MPTPTCPRCYGHKLRVVNERPLFARGTTVATANLSVLKCACGHSFTRTARIQQVRPATRG